MAINLDHSIYGAQFNAFRNLATQANLTQDTLVSVDEAGRGKGLLNESGESRKIVVKKGDTIRPLFGRSQGHVDLNNEVRDLFKETVLKVCGATTIRELPASVRKAMKENDFKGDGGHPLSVRRILAVTRAIRMLDDKEIPIAGNAAKELCDIILPGSGLEREKYKGRVLKGRMKECATASVQTYAAGGIAYLKGKNGKLDLDKYTGTFQMDVARGFKIRLNNGSSISELGVEKARDA